MNTSLIDGRKCQLRHLEEELLLSIDYRRNKYSNVLNNDEW